MHIVNGRGNHRRVFVFPDASIVNRSPPDQQVAARNLLCDMMKVYVPEMERAL